MARKGDLTLAPITPFSRVFGDNVKTQCISMVRIYAMDAEGLYFQMPLWQIVDDTAAASFAPAVDGAIGASAFFGTLARRYERRLRGNADTGFPVWRSVLGR